MTESCRTAVENLGFCEKCHGVVPVVRVQRENSLYLVRECPECGTGETLVSRDVKAYYEKREFMGYTGDAQKTCPLDCVDCRHGVTPIFVVIDVTNRCNMNCPICLANIQSMGMEFNPPIEYFDKIFLYLSKLNPRPKIQLFGGEPTCREDLPQILKLARKRGFNTPRLVTNGLRFADEEYCKTVLATKPQIMLGLDGLNPEVQKKLRKNPGSLERKLKAIENIEKHSESKICIMCTTAVGISEQLVPDLISFCHEKRNLINRIMLIPLQATAGPELVGMESSTIEDVEHMMEQCFPGLQFVPAGALRQMNSIMGLYGQNVSVGGSHPNCECFTFMVTDPDAGEYRPIGEFLKISFKDAVRSLIALDRELGPKLQRSLLGRLFGRTGQKIHVALALAGWGRRNIKVGRFIAPHPVRNLFRAIREKLSTGRRWGKILPRHMWGGSILQMIILPYEEPGCLESARLIDCPVSFACEHPVSADVTLVPFCSYFVHKNDILRKTADRWANKPAEAQLDAV